VLKVFEVAFLRCLYKQNDVAIKMHKRLVESRFKARSGTSPTADLYNFLCAQDAGNLTYCTILFVNPTVQEKT